MVFRELTVLGKRLVRLRGPDALPLLHGLLTNEVNSTQPVIYSYLLNSQGRLLFDLFLYRLAGDDVLLEVDSSAEQSLIKALNIYKLRRSVKITSSTLSACVAPRPNLGLDVPVLIQEADPRLPELGYKLVVETAPSGARVRDDGYRELRYRLGVPEGSAELGIGKAIPLESNGDHLKAISFEKGCYIGQELTARAYHTGVVRKRYMPLKFYDLVQEFQPGSDIAVLNENNAKVGVLKAALGNRGLGLMRIKECLEAQVLMTTVNDIAVQLDVQIPTWWPKNR